MEWAATPGSRATGWSRLSSETDHSESRDRGGSQIGPQPSLGVHSNSLSGEIAFVVILERLHHRHRIVEFVAEPFAQELAHALKPRFHTRRHVVKDLEDRVRGTRVPALRVSH